MSRGKTCPLITLSVEKPQKQSSHLFPIPVLHRPHPHVPFEIFPEKRDIREVEGIGDLLDGEGRRFQLCLRVHDHHVGDDVRAGLSRHLLDDRAEVGRRDAQLLRVERDVALLHVVVDDQLRELLADALARRQLLRRGLFLLVGHAQPVDNHQQQLFVEILVRDPERLAGADQRCQVPVDRVGHVRVDGQHRHPLDGIGDVHDRFHRVHLFDKLRGEADEIKLHLALDAVDLQDAARQDRHNLVAADAEPLQVDRSLDISLAAKDEDFRLDAAGEVRVEIQDLGVHQFSGDNVFRQVDFRYFVVHGGSVFIDFRQQS